MVQRGQGRGVQHGPDAGAPVGAQATATRAPESTRTTARVVFAASLVVHALVAARIQASAGDHVRPLRPRQIDIEFAPPPPPKEEPPPPEPEPEVAPPPKAERPRAVKPLPVPVQTPQPAQPSADPDLEPEPDTTPLPSSDEGTLPPRPQGNGVAQAVVAPPAPPTPPAPVVEAKEGANYLHNPRPGYPRIALREGWEGRVVLRVRVLPNGKVGGATVQVSAGRPELDDAALDTVRSWTFQPATQGGKPIAGWVSVPIEFRLN